MSGSLLFGSLGDELSELGRGGRIRNLEVRALLATGLDAPETSEVVTPAPRTSPGYVIDLFPGAGPTSSAMYFVRETTLDNESGATSVPENTPKPEQDLAFHVVEDKPVFTTGWFPVTSEILDDASSLDAYIRSTLVHRLKYRQSRQALYGAGSGSHQLNGILTDDDHQTSTAASLEAAVVKALGMVESTGGGGLADGLVVSPVPYWASVEANPSLWREIRGAGVRIVRSTAIADDTVLAGAWRVASALRAGLIDIEVADQHSDYMVKNKLVVRAEQRMQTGWTAPDLFAEVTVA